MTEPVAKAQNTHLVRQGIAAAKEGDRARARELLLAAAEIDPGYELAWLWLASVAESREDTARYLERALTINPDDQRALSWLTHVREQMAPPRRAWRCPLCGAGSLVAADKCPSCRAVVSLDDLQALLENDDVDRDKLREVVARLEAVTGDRVDFEMHYRLGLAYLNLKRVYEGLTRLRVASQLHPADRLLEERIQELVRRQEEQAAALDALDETGAHAAPGAGAGKRTVLVVDDSPTVLKIVGMALESQGHQVLVAANAMQALAKLDETTPDLILLDITMPHMDGYQLCKLIKGNPLTGDVPVVMLSGKDGFFDKVRGRLAGSADYITKPFDPATLVEAVERHCRREA